MSPTATEAQAPVQAPPLPATADPVPAPPTAPVQSSPGAPRSNDEPKGKKAKGKESKAKGKKAKSTEDGAESTGSPSVAAHPRAARRVAQAKSWGGLAGFFIAGYLSLPTGTLAETGLRALVAGGVCYVAAWGGSVFVWRRLIVIELKGREQQLLHSQSLTSDEAGAAPVEPAHMRATS